MVPSPVHIMRIQFLSNVFPFPLLSLLSFLSVSYSLLVLLSLGLILRIISPCGSKDDPLAAPILHNP